MADEPVNGSTGVMTVATGAGMLALWNASAFHNIVDYDTWEPELLDDKDIRRHIHTGHLVPINICSDGAFGVVVRTGTSDRPAVLTERERRHLVVSSQPYRLAAVDKVCLSGLEAVIAEPYEETIQIPVGTGEHSVTIHLIDWQAEPESCNADGSPTETALPDFAVVINPATVDRFRIEVETFDRP